MEARALRISEERLSLALEGTATGSWEWDIKADVIRWSEMVGPLHGLERGAQRARSTST
jgi:PAS domain-containing protein